MPLSPPKVKEDADKTGKKTFINMKNIIWHEAVRGLLESIELHSKTGCNVHCGDGVWRVIVPVILILSADYEEQCVVWIYFDSAVDRSD
jgi:Plavaka transposase